MTTKKKSSFRGKVASNAERTAKSGASYGHLRIPRGIDVFNPDPDGKYKLDFLPYIVTDPKHPDRDDETQTALEGDPWYRRPYKLHRNVGASDESAVCLTSIGKKCPVCEHRAKRSRDGADKEELSSMNASKRMLYIVIPLDSKKHDPKIHIFDISEYNFTGLLTQELKEDPDHEIFPDLEEGETLRVRFEAATVGNSKAFPQANRIDFLERDEAYDEGTIDKVPNLDEVLQILTYDQLRDKFFETEGEEDGGRLKPEEDEETTPIRRKKTVNRKEEEEEEEEEEKPTRRKKVVKDEDEDEDDKPTRSSRKNKCPHGHKFGVDHDEEDECNKCKLWDDCLEEKEK